MRRVMAGCVVAAMVMGGGVSSAVAQTNELVREEFVEIEALRLEGAHKHPDLMRARARDRAKFDRLARIKKSVLSRVVESAGEPAL